MATAPQTLPGRLRSAQGLESSGKELDGDRKPWTARADLGSRPGGGADVNEGVRHG